MAKITFSPTKELVIHDIVRVEIDDMLRGRVTPAGTMPLYWCNGIVFAFSSLPMTEGVVADYIKGTIHWLEIQYASMPDYTPVLSLNEDEYKTVMKIRIIDTSKSALHSDLTKWLKTLKA
ncbi:MAG: hypothetical protein M1305_04020 [Candidatus Marsarchaeota archaeon]|jgi:hypothetical protein|nr:hypothetical protein [Candidatus Marsarchaeota archaeon]MCL5419429.1 hypothetical protein [Candidatus Marsarchaeota archaeon]